MTTRHGFTIAEIIIVLGGLSLIAAIYFGITNNYGKIQNTGNAGTYLSNVGEIELAVSRYLLDKGEYPEDASANGDIMDETTFQEYIYPPKGPDSLEDSTGTNGYQLSHISNQVFICAVLPADAADKQNFVDYITEKTATGKFYYSDSCPATSNGSVGDADLYLTYWIVK